MIQSQIYDRISNMCEGRVFHLLAEQQADPPYIVFTVISHITEDVLCGIAEQYVRIQIDVYATKFTDAGEIIEEVMDRLSDLKPGEISTLTDKETDTNLYRVTKEFLLVI